MENAQLIALLKQKYPGVYQDDVLETNLSKMVPQTRDALSAWLTTGEMSDMEVEGYSIENLMSGHGMNTAAAHFTLDWLMREPNEAKASLEKGHDQVTTE